MDITYLDISGFSPEIYRISPDLRGMSKEQLIDHYLTYGINEGRIYNRIVDRRSFIDSLDKKGRILEILSGEETQLDTRASNYKTLDIGSITPTSKNDVIQSSTPLRQPDYKVTNGDYTVVKDHFNCIFASHILESAQDPVGFLAGMVELLPRDGSLNLVIADKRYSSDRFIPETDVFEVLQRNLQKPSLPDFAHVLRMKTQATHNDHRVHWSDINQNTARPEPLTIEQFDKVVEEYNTTGCRDLQANHFTPQSFMSIINVLKNLGLINLKIHRLFHTVRGSGEFYVVLRKNDPVN